MTIKLETTVYKGRYNLVNTEKKDDYRYIKQLTRCEAVDLMDNIRDTLLEG